MAPMPIDRYHTEQQICCSSISLASYSHYMGRKSARVRALGASPESESTSDDCEVHNTSTDHRHSSSRSEAVQQRGMP